MNLCNGHIDAHKWIAFHNIVLLLDIHLNTPRHAVPLNIFALFIINHSYLNVLCFVSQVSNNKMCLIDLISFPFKDSEVNSTSGLCRFKDWLYAILNGVMAQFGD